jgi:hypothetical protein
MSSDIDFKIIGKNKQAVNESIWQLRRKINAEIDNTKNADSLFLPQSVSVIDGISTTSNIETMIRRNTATQKQSQSEQIILRTKIQNDAPRLFALMIYSKLSIGCLVELMLVKGYTDAHLPIQLEGCPDHWIWSEKTTSKYENFVSCQHYFTRDFLESGKYDAIIPSTLQLSRCIIETSKKESLGGGAQGNVDKIFIAVSSFWFKGDPMTKVLSNLPQ